MSADVLLGLLNTLPLHSYYKTKHLLETLANFPTADLPNNVPDCICCPEPVFLNAVNNKTKNLPSAGISPWHLDNDDPGYQNKECRIKRIWVYTTNFASDIYHVPATKQLSLLVMVLMFLIMICQQLSIIFILVQCIITWRRWYHCQYSQNWQGWSHCNQQSSWIECWCYYYKFTYLFTWLQITQCKIQIPCEAHWSGW